MLQQEMFTIRDSKSGTFQPPWYAANKADAERQFKTSVNSKNENNIVALYPEDFDLYYVGKFNILTGEIEKLDSPEHITKGVNLKRQS